MPRSATPPHRRGMVAILAIISTARKRLGSQPFCRGFTSLMSLFTALWRWYVQPRTRHFPRLLILYARFRPFQPRDQCSPHWRFPPWLPIHWFRLLHLRCPASCCLPAVCVTDGNWELVLVGFRAVCHSGRGTFSHVSHVCRYVFSQCGSQNTVTNSTLCLTVFHTLGSLASLARVASPVSYRRNLRVRYTCHPCSPLQGS